MKSQLRMFLLMAHIVPNFKISSTKRISLILDIETLMCCALQVDQEL